MRAAISLSYDVLRARERGQLHERICSYSRHLLGADGVRLYAVDVADERRLVCTTESQPLPACAERMESELSLRALAQGRSLVSSHPGLDPQLASLAASCRREQVTVHVLLARAYGRDHAIAAVHWLGTPRPDYEQRVGFYLFWDYVGMALARTQEAERVSSELERLRALALSDDLTGLANGRALRARFDLELAAAGAQLSVLVLDFDGLRQINNELGYEAGNELIRQVGRALAAWASPDELVARLHTAGDEFVCLLPGAGEREAEQRAAEVEQALEAIELSEPHGRYWRGASIGCATLQPGESPSELLARAGEAMRRQKRRRNP